MAIAIPIVLAVIAAKGAIDKTNAETAAASRNAAISARNATISRQQGEAAATQQERINYLRLSQINANVGASGITQGGSAMDILESSTAQAALDVQNIRYNASLKAMGFDENAELNIQAAKTSSEGGRFNAVSAGLQGYAAGGGGFGGTGTKIQPSPMDYNYG